MANGTKKKPDPLAPFKRAVTLATRTLADNKSMNVVFGSDWPFPMGLVEPHAQLASLDPVRRRRIFCDNPDRLAKETEA